MSEFERRKQGFEGAFAHDEQLRFRAAARRNKLLGLWAAEKMGLDEAAAEAYAREVIVADLQEAGDEDVFRKLRADFDDRGMDVSDHRIRRTMQEMMATAVEQIRNEA